MVITFSRLQVWINQVWCQSCSWSAEQRFFFPLSPFALENLVSQDGFGRPFLRQPPILRTQAGSGAYSRDSSRFPDGVHMYHQPPSGQSRVYRITHLRTDGIHCQESAGTGPVVLKVVPATGAAFSGVTMDQLMCTSLFPHPLLV